MSQDFATLDPKQFTFSFAGVPIQGFAEGTGVRLSNITDGFTDKVGMDSLVVRTKTNDRRGTVEFILMSSSSSNSVLSGIHNLDLETPNGSGVGTLFIRDRQGNTVYEAARAWIVKAPDAEIASEETSRTWAIRCAKLNRVDGSR